MDWREERDRVIAYVVARLRAELVGAPRGAAANLARITGITTAHISNMCSSNPTREPGEDVRRALSRYWGFASYAEMEIVALSESRAVSPKR